MNHHETVEMIRGMNLRGEQALQALPQSTEVVLGVFRATDSITVAYTTRFGNEAVAHLRTVKLVGNSLGRWELATDVTLPMAAEITSRTGANLKGLPGLVPNSGTLPDFSDPTRTAPSVVPKRKV